jgi:hypothetical protein
MVKRDCTAEAKSLLLQVAGVEIVRKAFRETARLRN